MWLIIVADLVLQFSADPEKTHLYLRNIWQSLCLVSTAPCHVLTEVRAGHHRVLLGRHSFYWSNPPCHMPFLPLCCLWNPCPPASTVVTFLLCPWPMLDTRGFPLFPNTPLSWASSIWKTLIEFLGKWGQKEAQKKKLKLNFHLELHWPHLLLGKFLSSLVDFRYLQMDEYMSSVYLGLPPHPLKMFTYLDASDLCCITWDLLLRQAYLVASGGIWDVTSSPEIVPASPALEGGSLNTEPTGRFPPPHFFINFFSNILQNPSPSYHKPLPASSNFLKHFIFKGKHVNPSLIKSLPIQIMPWRTWHIYNQICSLKLLFLNKRQVSH